MLIVRHYNGEAMKNILIAISFLILTGCAASIQIERVADLSVAQLRKVNGVNLIKEPKGLDYVFLGKIKGLSCDRRGRSFVYSLFSDNTSEEAAITQLKIKAAKLGANAVLNIKCSANGIDWANNCWHTWICIGEAVLVK